MHAASNGHEAAMKVLLQEGADHTVQAKVSEGVSEGGSAPVFLLMIMKMMMCMCVCVCVCGV
jgi:hypothetical protein